MKNNIVPNIEEVCIAMEDNLLSCFLNLVTGEIIMVSDCAEDRDKILVFG